MDTKNDWALFESLSNTYRCTHMLGTIAKLLYYTVMLDRPDIGQRLEAIRVEVKDIALSTKRSEQAIADNAARLTVLEGQISSIDFTPKWKLWIKKFFSKITNRG